MQDAERPRGGTLRADSRRRNGGRRPACLTSRQRLFVDHYLVHVNATQAAIGAGYSRKTADSQGQRLLKNVEVAEAIEAAMRARAERTEVNADRVVLELARIAFSDVTRIVQWGPKGVKLRPSAELSTGDRATIAKVSETVGRAGGGRTVTVKLHDKLGALVALGKHVGLFRGPDTITLKELGVFLDALVIVLGRYVAPERVKEVIAEVQHVAQAIHERFGVPEGQPGTA